jgi:hypothetical protein
MTLGWKISTVSYPIIFSLLFNPVCGHLLVLIWVFLAMVFGGVQGLPVKKEDV